MKRLLSVSLLLSTLCSFIYGMEQQLIPRFATTHKDALLSPKSNDQDIMTYLSQSNMKTQSTLKNSSLLDDTERANLTENKSLTQAILDAINKSNKLSVAKDKARLEKTISGNIIKIADLSKKISFDDSDKIAIASLKKSPLFQQENINILSQEPNWKSFQEACELLHSLIADFPIPQTIKSAIDALNAQRNQPLFINKEENKDLSDAAKKVIGTIIFIADNIESSNEEDKQLIAQLKNHPLLAQNDISKPSLMLHDVQTQESINKDAQWPSFEKACQTVHNVIPAFPIPYIFNLQGMKKLQNNIEEDAVFSGTLSVHNAYKQLNLYFPEDIKAFEESRTNLEDKILEQEERKITFIEKEEKAIEKEEKELEKEEKQIAEQKNRKQFKKNELLERLQKHRFEEKTDYNRIYFEGIARNIDMETRLLEHDFSQDRLSLLSKYKELLNFHAQRYIELLAKNPNISKEEKIASLEKAFPQNNELLKGYLNTGLQDINIYEMKRKTENLQKNSTKQTGQLASLEQRIKKQELIQEKENEKIDAFMQALIIQQKNYAKEEKINLLRSIMESLPEQELHVNPNLYTPDVFKELFLEIEKKENNKENPTDLLNELENKAVTYINYVVTNNEWETLGDKLAEIEKHLSDYTLFYLQKAAKYNKPLQKVNELENLPKKGFAEEFSFEEEEPHNALPSQKVIEEKPLESIPQIIIPRTPSSTLPELSSEETESQEPSAPGFLANIGSALFQAASFVWEGVNNFFNFIYNFFSGYIQR